MKPMTNLPIKLLKKYPGSIADNLCKVLSLVDLTKMSLIFRKCFLGKHLHKNGSKPKIGDNRQISMFAKLFLNLEKFSFGFCSDQVETDIHPNQFGVQSDNNAIKQLIDFVESLLQIQSPQF